MCFFRKKRESVKAIQEKELVSDNEKSIDALIVLAEQQEENEDFIAELKKLKESIKYLIPSTDSKVHDYDKKIKNLIGDLRIVLVKEDGEKTDKAKKILTQIKLAIADRNVQV